MNDSEKWAYDLSVNSFFSVFTYVNPIGKKGKELCDVLIVCNTDIIIISVKVINIKLSKDYDVDFKRWNKSAITKSVKQLNGAERFIQSSTNFKTDKGLSIELPKKKNIYKIALVIGSLNKFPLFQDANDINILDEKSFHSIITELDTIKDFIGYLKEKKENLTKVKVMGESEEDLLALYLQQELTFQDGMLIRLDSNMYKDLKKEDFYIQEKIELENSYKWDVIIENATRNYFRTNQVNEINSNKIKSTIYIMAQETRQSRKILVESLEAFIKIKSRSRIIYSETSDHVIYVLLSAKFSSVEERIKELEIRLFLTAYLFNKDAIVIGIYWEESNKNIKDAIYDLAFHNYKGLWKKEYDERAVESIKELGYFKNIYEQRVNIV